MINAYIINLDKDKDRLDFMETQLSKYNLKFQRFPALSPKDLSEREWENVDYERIKKNYHTDFRPGEVACAYSHKALMERIVAENIDLALILEDDVALNPAFFDYYTLLFSNLKKGKLPEWDYLQCNYHIMDSTNFNYFFWGTLSRINSVGLLEKIGLLFKIVAGIGVMMVEYCMVLFGKLYGVITIRPLRSYSMAGTYFITNSGAKKILETMNNNIIAPADIIQNIAKREKGLNIKILVPQLSIQNSLFESNTLTLK